MMGVGGGKIVHVSEVGKSKGKPPKSNLHES